MCAAPVTESSFIPSQGAKKREMKSYGAWPFDVTMTPAILSLVSADLVRSKSELTIADKLHTHRIEYAYEQPLILGEGRVRYPDFTITDSARGVTFYWEHLGLLDDPWYRARWERKRDVYRKAGIIGWDEGGGEAGTLIITRDDPGGALDSGRIAKLIEDVFFA